MIIENITREDYQAIKAVNASKLKPYFESALNGLYEENKPRTESAPMAFGTTAHSMILEPFEFANIYAKTPDEPTKEDGSKINKNTKVYKEWKADLPADKKYINHEDWELLERIQTNIDNCEQAQFILNKCPKRETCVTWTDKRTGTNMKALIDGLGDNTVMDYKTTRSIPYRYDSLGHIDIDRTQEAIKWDLYYNRNLLQAGCYFTGCIENELNVKRFAFVFSKNNGAGETASCILSDETLQLGVDMFNKALDNYLARNETKSVINEMMVV